VTNRVLLFKAADQARMSQAGHSRHRVRSAAAAYHAVSPGHTDPDFLFLTKPRMAGVPDDQGAARAGRLITLSFQVIS
jgi:hypothetical protein